MRGRRICWKDGERILTDYEFFLETLEELVATPSESQHERSAAEKVARILRELGYQPQLQSVGDGGANVVAHIPGGNGPRVLLGGHIDTVPICGGWVHDPRKLTIEGGRAYGLGACDMKGGIAALLTVLRRFAILGEMPAGDILFAALADEERLSLGAEVFGAGRPKADLCILAEPHYDEFVVGATGKILLELTVRGACGHAARPETGVNAIECMSRFLTAVDQKYRALDQEGAAASHCTLHIWNDYPSYSLNIPDTCCVLFNKQLLPTEDADSFQQDLQHMFARICPEASLAIERRRPYYPAYRTDTASPLFLRLRHMAEQVMGRPVSLTVNQSVSDGNIIEPILSIPTVVFGPKGVGCHKPDEYLEMGSVLPYVDILYRFLS